MKTARPMVQRNDSINIDLQDEPEQPRQAPESVSFQQSQIFNGLIGQANEDLTEQAIEQKVFEYLNQMYHGAAQKSAPEAKQSLMKGSF